MSDLYSNDKIRECAERLVDREVLYCASSLIYELTRDYDVISKLDIEEDINAINEYLDWDEPAERYIDDDMDRDELMEYLDECDVDYAPDEPFQGSEDIITEKTTTDELKKLALEAMQAEVGGAKQFCEDHDIEPDRSEVFEHWIVSSWLSRKLAEKGHAVGEVLGLTIWGRPTTGQSISMDSVILQIANDLENMK